MEESVGSIQVPKFSPAESYDKWRYKFMLLLEMRNCKDVIDMERRPETIKEADWAKKEIKAKNYIASAVDVDIIMDCKTAKDMISRLDRLYQKKSHSKQIMIEKKLCQLQYDETKSLEDFFATFERLIKELVNAGGSVDDKRKLSYLLMSLPDSLEYLTETVDLIPDNQKNVDYIREKLMLRKEVKNQRTSDSKNSTEIGQASHVFKASVKNEGRTNPNTKRDVLCFRCGKQGHIQKYCYHNREVQSRGRGTNYRRGSRGGNWRNENAGRYAGNLEIRTEEDRRDERNQQAMNAERRNTENVPISNFHTKVQANISEVNVSKTVNNVCIVKWLLDSGCTDHIVTDDKHFYISDVLKKPLDVKVGNGEIVKALKIGNILCEFKVKNEIKTVDIKNVYFVPNMGKNLLSVSCITDSKNNVDYRNNEAKIYNSEGNIVAVAIKKKQVI